MTFRGVPLDEAEELHIILKLRNLEIGERSSFCQLLIDPGISQLNKKANFQSRLKI